MPAPIPVKDSAGPWQGSFLQSFQDSYFCVFRTSDVFNEISASSSSLRQIHVLVSGSDPE